MPEYYISRAALGKTPMQWQAAGKFYFTLVKFEGEEQPDNVYTVMWDVKSDIMQCSCPNRRRGAHVEDKHCKFVRNWLAAGEPTTPITPGKEITQ